MATATPTGHPHQCTTPRCRTHRRSGARLSQSGENGPAAVIRAPAARATPSAGVTAPAVANPRAMFTAVSWWPAARMAPPRLPNLVPSHIPRTTNRKDTGAVADG